MRDSSFNMPYYDSLTRTYITVLDSNFDATNTSAIDYDTKGQFQLATGENYNLARGRYCYVVYNGTVNKDHSNGNFLIDGATGTYVSFNNRQNGGLTGSYIVIDLQAIRNVNQVRFFTFPVTGRPMRLRTYSIYTGLDTLSLERAYFENNNLNTETDITTVKFSERLTRYIVITVEALELLQNVTLTEIQVYGIGFLPDGILYSSVRSIPKNVNFSKLSYTGKKPNSTQIGFSVRTGPKSVIDSTWSDWSPEVSGDNSFFDVAEPRKYFQYKVRLATDTLNTPVINTVTINYDTLLVADSTFGAISPQEATALKEQEFTLSVRTTQRLANAGVDSLYFVTPSPITLKDIKVNDTSVAFSSQVTFKDVKIGFPKTIKGNSTIKIVFVTIPFVDNKPHTVWLISNRAPDNPQRVDTKRQNNIEAWSLILTGVPKKLVNSVKLNPNPFSPNGDGINDDVYLEFYLAKIGEGGGYVASERRNISIEIFDLRGRKIRELIKNSVNATAFAGDNQVIWNGRDDNGITVRPGVYIMKIKVSSDNGTENYAKTVTVTY